MPELPEVETIRRGIEKAIVGKKILRVEIRWRGIVRGRVDEFLRNTEGRKVVDTGRRGKYLIIHLSSERSLIVHLKMSGVLSHFEKHVFTEERIGKHTHMVFCFTGGAKLLFTETRKFGFVENIPTHEMGEYFARRKMGPEPLEHSFSVHQFIGSLKAHPKTAIKSALLNQRIIAGVGNIYADEALYRAGIRPTRRVASLKERELRHLFQGVQNVLQTGIRRLGTTLRFYQNIFGEAGRMADYLKVYGREGARCRRCCRSRIKRIVIAGRSSHYCPVCQK